MKRIDQIESLDLQAVPERVAIIMDGNRRWARKNRVPSAIGHWKGANALMQTASFASKLGIKVLTVFAFSTENWKRSEEEVSGLMHLLKMYLIRLKDYMVREGVKIGTIGDLTKLPLDVQEVLSDIKDVTSSGSKIELVLAINYGARDEIRRATIDIVNLCMSGKLKLDEINEKVIAQHLDSARWEDPQLLIRTSGEKRLSNFLLWQISYSELYITDVLWPDFNENELTRAIIEFQQRKRRNGE
jgi:undecaprenyl diphosphate synthase